MRCEHCGRTAGDPTPPCPRCPDVRSTEHSSSPAVPESDTGSPKATTVVDAEVVNEGEARSGQKSFTCVTGDNGRVRYSFASWNVGGTAGGTGGFSGGVSCLPGCITLFLMALCAVQFGVLAAVGFLFFYLIGSWIAIFAGLQRAMRGKLTNPWLPRIFNWGTCWLLVGWLSGGF